MVYPVFSGILGEREVSYDISVDFVMELKEDSETRSRKSDMRRFGKDVIV
jgi:hypothetical protein